MRRLGCLLLVLLAWGCAGRGTGLDSADSLYEPDRMLFDRAVRELDRSRHTIARLALQTLINTYPDSEYLPQAKYAMAESYYEEGGRSALIQAEAGFKDYITFFPTSDLADDAQLMVAMTHVSRMEKPDRDPTQALIAEFEFRNMIERYPDSSLLDEAKAKLRAVQEVLADGVFRIGNFYFIKKSYRAAAGRYQEVLVKYPDYSQVPSTLYALADSVRRDGDEQEAAIYFSRIVSDHPLSAWVEDAKKKLVAMNQPVPDANPAALARVQQERGEGKGLFGKLLGMLSRRPDVATDTDAISIVRENRANGSSDEEEEEADRGGDGPFGIEGQVVNPPSPSPPSGSRKP